ncbi:MAG: hypothetical protein CMJ93_01160 [Planctomycetes bacterium]|nr:hypothetical protein [Planctomycetota bacterium]|tara:strand:- start:209 stop:778 length:570 start_codon:yes stop_codon:yes gene_type:complete
MIMKLSRNNRISTAGFTLIEIMIATSIAMVLLFGALYSTSETLGVVREGDIRMHTNVNARRALNRLIKDCRYASEIEVTGTQQTGWAIRISTTGALAPGEIEYTWGPSDNSLRVALVGGMAEEVIFDVRTFNVDTLKATRDGIEVISRISFRLIVGLDDGHATGAGNPNPERTFELAGTTWIQRNDWNN